LNELRADGRMVVDAPARKVAVYANGSGCVVLLTVDTGERRYFDVTWEEVPAVCSALMRAAREAAEISGYNEAQYATYLAIEQAKER
jgi:hypothetical protein